MAKHIPSVTHRLAVNAKALRIFSCPTFGINRHHDALGAIFIGRIANHLRIGNRRRVKAHFVCACIEQSAHIFHSSHTATHRQRNKHLRRHRFDDVQDDIARVAGSSNVQEGKFVSALVVVTRGDFNGVARIAQFHKVHAFDNATAGDIQARNDALGEHL